MRRHVRSSLAAILLAFAVPAAHATLIDSFETGGFSMSFDPPGQSIESQTPDPSHCIDNLRRVIMTRFANSTGPFTAELVPLQNVDDAVLITFPSGGNGGELVLSYSGGPWDLTEGGPHNHVAVRASGGAPETSLGVYLEDSSGNYDWHYLTFSGAATYRFPFSTYGAVNFTQIVKIEVSVWGTVGQSVGIQDVATSSESIFGLVYRAWEPRVFSWFCGPRGGGAAIGWDWAMGVPGEPALAGPQLQIQGISGAGCAGVEFEAQDSGGAGYGEVGLITVDWQAASFDNGIFELAFVTDPAADYIAQSMGDPVVEIFPNGFRITHDTHISHGLATPDGVARQELIVAPAPGQQIWLDYVDALPLGGPSEVGYSLSFAYTGELFDPGQPLLEIYTTSSFADDAGVTGVDVAGTESLSSSLRALPSVTRAGTRFVLAGEPRGPATIDIFDVMGRRVRRLEAHGREAVWNGTDDRGVRVPAGVYFGRNSGSPQSARVVLIR